MKPLYMACLITPSLLVAAIPARAQGSLDELATAIREGTHALNFRLRHESVEQDNPLEDADATTLRSRLTLNTGSWGALSATLEFDNVSTIGSDSYDSFVMDEYRGTHSVIADPVYTEVNQAVVKYTASDAHSFSFGRQRINHADQRFVGGVGWRQNEQTYDAVSWAMKKDAFTVDYSYIFDINRIFNASSPSVQITDFKSDSHILLGTYKQSWGTLKGFVYALDMENADAMSSLTYGLGYTGTLGPVTLNASYATQSDYADAPVDYDADFFSVDASVMAGPVKLLAGYDLLGSDDGTRAFATPLATLHKWQGWADIFLATPANGIEDLYFTASGTVAGFSLSATYHTFEADEGGADYGDEIDFSVDYKINDVVSTQLKLASYDSDGLAVDTDKLWFSVILAF